MAYKGWIQMLTTFFFLFNKVNCPQIHWEMGQSVPSLLDRQESPSVSRRCLLRQRMQEILRHAWITIRYTSAAQVPIHRPGTVMPATFHVHFKRKILETTCWFCRQTASTIIYSVYLNNGLVSCIKIRIFQCHRLVFICRSCFDIRTANTQLV